jgi:hypothetical protein
VLDASKKLKDLSVEKKLSSNLSTWFDTKVTGKYHVKCNGHVIALDEKHGKLLFKEMEHVFGVKDDE